MSPHPTTEGPGPPDAVAAAPEHRVNLLVPFVHVEDVERSIAFYHHLGLTLASVYKYKGRAVWAALESDRAELMVSTDGDAVDPTRQGVLFYLYSPDLTTLREQLLAAGIEPGEIEDGAPGPTQEMRLTDPDGYVLKVAQIDWAAGQSMWSAPAASEPSPGPFEIRRSTPRFRAEAEATTYRERSIGWRHGGGCSNDALFSPRSRSVGSSNLVSTRPSGRAWSRPLAGIGAS